MKTPVLLCFLALAAAPALAQDAGSSKATSQACMKAGDKEIGKLFDRWNTSLRAGDPQAVVHENYAPNAVLLPTVEDGPYTNDSDKIAYFKLFLKKAPVGKIVEREKVSADCNTAVDTGLYDFTYGDGTVVHARYTFTYRWFSERKAWLITSHHSSVLPAR